MKKPGMCSRNDASIKSSRRDETDVLSSGTETSISQLQKVQQKRLDTNKNTLHGENLVCNMYNLSPTIENDGLSTVINLLIENIKYSCFETNTWMRKKFRLFLQHIVCHAKNCQITVPWCSKAFFSKVQAEED